MKIGDGLQKLDVNKDADKVKANMGGAMKRTTKQAPSIKRSESGPTKPLTKPKPKPKPKPRAPYDDSNPKPKPKPKTGPKPQGPKTGPKPKTGGPSTPTSKKAPSPFKRSGTGKRNLRFSSGGMAEDKRKDKSEKDDKKGSKKYKRGELVEASYGKSVRKKKK